MVNHRLGHPARKGMGLLAAWLAICLQIFALAGAAPMPDAAPWIDQAAICGIGHTHAPAAPHHKSNKLACESCPGCQLAAHAGAPLPQAAPTLFVPYAAALLPPATAGPAAGKNAPQGASFPRGPPIFA